MKSTILIALVSASLIVFGCDGDDGGSHADGGTCPPCQDAGLACPGADGGGVVEPRRELGIFMQAGHVHIHRDAAIVFTVRDLADCTNPDDQTTCTAIPDLTVEVHRRHEDATQARVQTMEAGVLDDNGDGTYTWIRNFADAGGYSVGFAFELDGHHYMAAFPLHASQAGGERIFCGDAAAPDYAFQIRWSNSPGHVHTTGEEATFDIELQRSFNTPVNTESPWMNQFDHLTPSDLEGGAPTIEVLDSTGTVVEALVPEYRGKGIYRVSRAFAEAELGGASDAHFNLRTSFTDLDGCVVDESGEEYEFRVAAGH